MRHLDGKFEQLALGHVEGIEGPVALELGLENQAGAAISQEPAMVEPQRAIWWSAGCRGEDK